MDYINAACRSGEQDQVGNCSVELFGVVRLLAGVACLTVPLAPAATLREVIGAMARQCPELVGPVLDPDRHVLVEGYIFNRAGRDFLPALDVVVRPGDRLLLLASVGGG